MSIEKCRIKSHPKNYTQIQGLRIRVGKIINKINLSSINFHQLSIAHIRKGGENTKRRQLTNNNALLKYVKEQ